MSRLSARALPPILIRLTGACSNSASLTATFNHRLRLVRPYILLKIQCRKTARAPRARYISHAAPKLDIPQHMHRQSITGLQYETLPHAQRDVLSHIAGRSSRGLLGLCHLLDPITSPAETPTSLAPVHSGPIFPLSRVSEIHIPT